MKYGIIVAVGVAALAGIGAWVYSRTEDEVAVDQSDEVVTPEVEPTQEANI